MDGADRFISEFDKVLRTLAGVPRAHRPLPTDAVNEATLTATERADSVALMRVNHCGEVAAQALYQGQALASSDAGLVAALDRAARDEEDHLAWTAARIEELGGHTSWLNPLWYAGSLAIGYAAGKAGDRWSLGFLAETEHQVEAHLEGHLARLSERDTRTRAVIEQMKSDERGHADMAIGLGAATLPAPAKALMRATAKIMTTLSYRL